MGQIRNEIRFVVVVFESIKDNKVGPDVWRGISRVDSFEQIIIDNVILWTNFVGAKISYETYGARV